jgi:hypothetical protein
MKTAVEWFAMITKELGYVYEAQFQQAKEMEKKQLYNFIDFINERHFNSFRISKDEVEQYYNETFKQREP